MYKFVIALLLVLLCSNSFAYDGTIKNRYGKVIGYVNVDRCGDVKTYDKYGRHKTTIEDSKIKNRYGRTTGSVNFKKD